MIIVIITQLRTSPVCCDALQLVVRTIWAGKVATGQRNIVRTTKTNIRTYHRLRGSAALL